MSVNKVILIGRLGKDPETRYTNSGAAVCNFSIATDETFKDRSGEKQKRTEWHKIVVWNKLAEICQQYLKKGHLVYLEGKIQTNEWTDKKTGEKKFDKQIHLLVMRMLEGRKDGGAPAPVAGASQDQEPPEITDEDIPF